MSDQADQICDEKLLKLKAGLKKLKTVAVAFSGGADSAFLLAVAARSGLKRLMAVTVDSVFVTRKEIEQARQTAADLGVMHQVLEVDILGCKQVTANSPDRCYHCKTLVFSLIRKAAEQAGMFHVLHGVNINDLSDYRPGLKAAEKLGVLSPLVEAGFSKHQIRICSREMGLPTWDLPSQSCLAARIPFWETITKETLCRIEQAEQYIQSLGFARVRVRSMVCWPVSKLMRRISRPWWIIGIGFQKP